MPPRLSRRSPHPRLPRLSRRARAGFALALLLLPALGGCAAPLDAAPFRAFSDSVRELRDGSDDALLAQAQRDRRRVLDGLVEDLRGEEAFEVLDALRYRFDPDDPFGYVGARPLFVVSARFRHDVLELNTQLVSYADLLVELAQEAPLEEATLDSLATEMNARTRSILERLDADGAGRASGLLSTAATAALRELVRSGQRDALRRALAENQEVVDTVAAHMVRACELVALDLRQGYLMTSERLQIRVADAIATDGLRSSVEELLDFNDVFATRLEILRGLRDGYTLLPAAHRELRGTLDGPGEAALLDTITRLAEQGRRLRQRYRDLVEGGDRASGQIPSVFSDGSLEPPGSQPIPGGGT